MMHLFCRSWAWACHHLQQSNYFQMECSNISDEIYEKNQVVYSCGITLTQGKAVDQLGHEPSQTPRLMAHPKFNVSRRSG